MKTSNAVPSSYCAVAVQKKSVNDDFEGSSKAKSLSVTAQKRLELAKFLGRSGRGVNCRIDMQILTLEDIKRAAFELDRLAKNLQKIAENLDQNDVLQVLSARHEFTKTKVQVKTFEVNNKEF
jgi:hypothetical protein